MNEIYKMYNFIIKHFLVIMSTSPNVSSNICALTSIETLPTESCLNNVVKALQHNFDI